MCDRPIAQSTPKTKILNLQKRPGIREVKINAINDSNHPSNDLVNFTIKAEIAVNNRENNSDEEITSESENNSELEDNSEPEDKTRHKIKDNTGDELRYNTGGEIIHKTGETTIENNYLKTKFNFGIKIFFLILLLAILFKSIDFFKSDRFIKKIDLEDLEQKYASQEKDFWISFEVLVQDSIKYNQPKCLVLLYNDSTINTVGSLLNDLSNYAVCKLSNCSSIPIIIEAYEFGERDAPFDYGKIITQNKNQLMESGVMVIKNMETVSAKSAMAFQSLCDEYQPVVSRALILFTLKIDQHPEDKTKYVEYILRKKWSALNDDLFYPLLTRISNFIFLVYN